MENDQQCGACCGGEAKTPTPTLTPESTASGLVFTISNMDCPAEEGLIRKHLQGRSEISALQFNLMERRLTVSTTLSVSAMQSLLQDIGMKAVPVSSERGRDADASEQEENSRSLRSGRSSPA